MKKVIIVLAIILVAVLAFFYFANYSEGSRVGTVIKVSKKGVIFKTYEGQLNLNAFGAVKGQSALNEAFEFSIPKDTVLLNKLDDLMGQPVKLSYKEKYFVFPWLGETKYLATDVELSEDGDSSREGLLSH